MNKKIKCITYKYIVVVLLLLFVFYFKSYNKATKKFALIEKGGTLCNNCIIDNNNFFQTHIVVMKKNEMQNISYSNNIYIIEHNLLYDDILFLVPLYNIIVKASAAIICNRTLTESEFYSIKNLNIINATTFKHCIIINIPYLKFLHLHSNLFRLCNYSEVYKKIKNNQISITYNSICNGSNYSLNYVIVTSVYRRFNLNKQIQLFNSQSAPPKHIIVVHDRNIIKMNETLNNLLYIHTVNFAAGFYFRYLIALLSPEDNVVIYDDDWFPMNISSHFTWISKMKNINNKIISHHTGSKNGIVWCATPLIIYRKWLYLMWYMSIYNENAAEDGHLSFSLLLLCNVQCRRLAIEDLHYKHDKLSSSKRFITSNLWKNYTRYIKNNINSSSISFIKSKYFIS